MQRRETHTIDEASGTRLAFSSAEDTLLAKLTWYRDGGEVSERQWHDALGIIRVSGGADRGRRPVQHQ